MPSLTPFNPEIHTPVDVGFGEPSTEYLITIEDDNGEVMVVPSIWWTADNQARFMGDPETDTVFQESVKAMAQKYEEETGMMFPRFGKASEETYRAADEWAALRSKEGGATQGFIAIKPEKVD